MEIPGDPSSSAFFVALTLFTKGSSLKIKNININPFRSGFIKILKKMNGNIKIYNLKKKFGEMVGDIIVKLDGFSVKQLHDIPYIMEHFLSPEQEEELEILREEKEIKITII